MNQTPLRCIIVGLGWLSGHMLKFLCQQPWYETAALVDVRTAALAETGAALDLPERALFTTLEAAIAQSEADAVLINTPSEWHYAQTKTALAAGLHVLVAKPITNSYEQAVELVQLAADGGATLSVGQQIRYNRHYTALQRFVAAGTLGRVEAAWLMNSKPRPNPANLAKFTQPSLYENACHHFDALLAVFGEPTPEWISCDGFIPSWSRYIGPCMVNALIRFSGNLHVAYHGGFSSQASMYEFRLEGEKGALACHGLHMSNNTMRYEFAPALGQFAPITPDEEIPVRDPFLPFLEHWRTYLQGGAEPPFSGRNNLKTFAMLSAAIDAVETGQPVAIADHPRYRGAFQ
jgi:predicted dehydrogenase